MFLVLWELVQRNYLFGFPPLLCVLVHICLLIHFKVTGVFDCSANLESERAVC